MRRRLAALLVLAVAAVLPAAAQTGGLRLVDVTPEVDRVWNETRTLPDAERVAVFKRRFATILPGFYDHERSGATDPARYDARLLAGLKRYPEERDAIAKVAREFAAMLAPAQASFERTFGAMAGYPPVYLVDSFGEFDGGTRTLPGGAFLMFGADVIARLHSNHSIRPFFHHELFHLYHLRRFRDCGSVWCTLWIEGLAVHVASRLNPGASDDELLLTQPQSLRDAVERDRRRAICAIASRLDSTRPEDVRALFSSGTLGPGLPPRFGYYVGLLAVQRAARGRSLRSLAALPPDRVRPLLERSLSDLADCHP